MLSGWYWRKEQIKIKVSATFFLFGLKFLFFVSSAVWKNLPFFVDRKKDLIFFVPLSSLSLLLHKRILSLFWWKRNEDDILSLRFFSLPFFSRAEPPYAPKIISSICIYFMYIYFFNLATSQQLPCIQKLYNFFFFVFVVVFQ